MFIFLHLLCSYQKILLALKFLDTMFLNGCVDIIVVGFSEKKAFLTEGLKQGCSKSSIISIGTGS